MKTVFAKQNVKIMQKSSRQEATHAFAAVIFIKITSIVQSAVMLTIHGMKHPKRAYKKAPEKGAFFLQKNKQQVKPQRQPINHKNEKRFGFDPAH